MPSDKVALLTHPVRARILAALLGRELTTQQLGQLLADLPLSSIYRHTRLLAEAGSIVPVREIRVSGALTKVYAVPRGGARLEQADTRGATPAEHLGYFNSFLNTLSELYRGYLAQEGADPNVDTVHGLIRDLHLSPEEYREFMEALGRFLDSWSGRAPEGDRRRLVFAHLMIPDQADPPVE